MIDVPLIRLEEVTDRQLLDDRIENLKALLRQNHQEGRQLARLLVYLEFLRFQDGPLTPEMALDHLCYQENVITTQLTKARQQEILSRYDAGLNVTCIHRELGLARPTIYRVLRIHNRRLKSDDRPAA